MKPILRLLLALVLPTLAGAQEKPTIETVKDELRTLPVTKAGIDQSRLVLPSIEAPLVPDAGLSLPTPEMVRPDNKNADGRKQSGNWLVDAMAREDDRRNTGRDGYKRDRDSDKNLTGSFLKSEKNESAVRGRTDQLSEERDQSLLQAPVDNPLLPFMADWITKRDQALLLPKLADGALRDGSRSFMSPGAAGESLGAGIPSEFGTQPNIATAQAMRQQDNPFLESLTSADSAAGRVSPSAIPLTPLPTLAERPNQFLPPPEKSREGKPAAAPFDLSKPTQDEKYFPQLKRF